jgi:4-hydroxy-tetrahydrodipicolinate synthase
LVQIAVETAAGRIPIIAATGTSCTRETIALTQAAQATGATAALIVTPYYNKPNQDGLYRHYCEIARSVELPIIVENDPLRSGVDIKPETLGRLAEIPNVVGIEDTTGDLGRLADKWLSMRADFIQLSGDDNTCVLFQMIGGRGSVSVVANVVPKLWAEMQQACRCGDWGRASTIQMRLLPLLSALNLETNPGPIKYALSFLRPWFSPTLRLPLVPVSYDTGNAIVEALTSLNLVG